VGDHGDQFVVDGNSLTRSFYEGRQVRLPLQLDRFADFAPHQGKPFQLDTEHCWWTLHQISLCGWNFDLAPLALVHVVVDSLRPEILPQSLFNG